MSPEEFDGWVQSLPQTVTPQGDLLVGRVIHGAAVNCLIVPKDEPDEWYFKQFFSTIEIERYAADYNLTIKLEHRQ